MARSLSTFLFTGLGLLALSCTPDAASVGGGYTAWTVGTYETAIVHAPKLEGWKPVKSAGVKFREYEIDHPSGKWIVNGEDPKTPIVITTASGKRHEFAGEWYPEEGGADSAAAYGFVKGDETLIILQGTSAVTYEETRFRFKGDELAELRRYATKGEGMGPEMPGKEPEHRVYPPLP